MSAARNTVNLETDLLILGSGAAGCGAALAAREAGVRTLVVDKGKLESSGCLGGGNDHFMAVLGTGEPDDTVDDLVKYYLKPCSGFTEHMLREWGRAMPYMVSFLEGLGVRFIHRADGSYLRTAGRGEPAWHINIAEGQRIGVQGTPYFLINNLVARGALSSDLFKEAINMALQAAPSGQK